MTAIAGLTDREVATLLAALRYYQDGMRNAGGERHFFENNPFFFDIASNSEEEVPLTISEIDLLGETINLSYFLRDVKPEGG